MFMRRLAKSRGEISTAYHDTTAIGRNLGSLASSNNELLNEDSLRPVTTQIASKRRRVPGVRASSMSFTATGTGKNTATISTRMDSGGNEIHYKSSKNPPQAGTTFLNSMAEPSQNTQFATVKDRPPSGITSSTQNRYASQQFDHIKNAAEIRKKRKSQNARMKNLKNVITKTGDLSNARNRIAYL